MAGLTQEQAANEIGTSVTNLDRWERGLGEPRLETLEALAALYECDVKNLFGQTSEPNKKKKKRR